MNQTRSPITTHVLDTSAGRAAKGISVTLEFQKNGNWKQIGKSVTDDNGRIEDLLQPGSEIEAGNYRLNFLTKPYFESQNVAVFYPYVLVTFTLTEIESHCHVPLLLNPFGYSTYRGT